MFHGKGMMNLRKHESKENLELNPFFVDTNTLKIQNPLQMAIFLPPPFFIETIQNKIHPTLDLDPDRS